MATQVIKANAHLKERVLVETTARQHRVIVDEPASLGGTDTAMNPVELLLSALGACQSIVARTYAEKFGINLNDFKVELEGDLDTDGFLGKADVRPGFSNIRSTYSIETDAPEEKVVEFLEFLENHCPVGDTIENAVGFSSSYRINQKA
ncbi:OsmC family protein [Oceanobacillus sp. CAU 1775]